MSCNCSSLSVSDAMKKRSLSRVSHRGGMILQRWTFFNATASHKGTYIYIYVCVCIICFCFSTKDNFQNNHNPCYILTERHVRERENVAFTFFLLMMVCYRSMTGLNRRKYVKLTVDVMDGSNGPKLPQSRLTMPDRTMGEISISWSSA